MRKFASVTIAVVIVAAVGVWWFGSQNDSGDPSTSAPTSIVRATTPSSTTLVTPASVCSRASKPMVRASRGTCSAWRPVDTWSRIPSVYTTSFRPPASQPGVVAYAAWIRTSSTELALYPGYEGPGPTTLARGPEMVPLAARSRLLATFNSGFYEADGAAGFYVHHTLYHPMIRGLATVVRYTNGTVDIIRWSAAARPGRTIEMARQNLPLLVNNGVATPLSVNNSLWGLTLHGVPAVWRTALGIDAQGNLVYVAAPDQTAQSLAATLVQLHLVRAMQLDINPEWPIFVTYGTRGAIDPSLFVPNPNQIGGRFLYSSTKDFFAVYSATKPRADQPW